MKTDLIQQEILLVAASTFSKRHCSEKDAGNNRPCLSATEQLEEACWNGLLNDLLPDIISQAPSGTRLFLWHTSQGESFVQLNLSAYPRPLEKEYSIDPYSILPALFYS